MAPHIFHYENSYPGIMVEGMVFTIEPMLNETVYGTCVEHSDRWTILTIDGARSAQFEQTLVITNNGVDIMTKHTPGYFDKK
jgi:methionyl aminopeptidase